VASGSTGQYLARPGQALAAHLRGVAALAEEFARGAAPGDGALQESARIAGLLHDLGKYRDEFQQRIRGFRQKSESTHHKMAGAAKVAEAKRPDIAFAIAGHHGGMPDKDALRSLIESRGGEDVAMRVWPDAIRDCPEVATPIPALTTNSRRELELRTRVLFSCLVDADWLDSSAAERGSPMERVPALEPDVRLRAVLEYIAARAAQCRQAQVGACRADVLAAALDRAPDPPGLFSMTVPTGGGKTLSALAFALAHAERHGLRRVIYVAPYLSIIEQNADVIRAALGGDALAPGFVLEHHSLAEPEGGAGDEETEDRARLAENWDAPVIVTTSVQFYESLFASKPGRCRKVHNVARSVVILDECQTLLPGLVAPTCRMLEEFARLGGCSIVLCTATQPAWEESDALPEGLHGVREIVPASLQLFERLKRVKVRWPVATDEASWTWDRVAQEMAATGGRALCVLNTRDAARQTFAALRGAWAEPGDVFHLSTYMCPEHRRRVLAECTSRLKSGRACLLVSTQCVEAGVDMDFPVVLRELGPLESIVQAAGRCNREGLLSESGRVLVFRSEGGLPPEWYRLGRDKVVEALRAGETPDTDDPDSLRAYFRRLYRSGDTDAEDIEGLRNALNFPEVANKYQLITDNSVSVVPGGGDRAEVAEGQAKEDAEQGQGARSSARPREHGEQGVRVLPLRHAGACAAGHARREGRRQPGDVLEADQAGRGRNGKRIAACGCGVRRTAGARRRDTRESGHLGGPEGPWQG
jgi:CRISPR-associated endonuclease/helicase Cas3